MTPLQEKEFEMLGTAVDICDKLGLRYYLLCGSALGAVKYRGFIPWDDDVDIGLPREEYEIFISQAQHYLPKNLFLQNYRTDPAFPQLFSKIRNSDTTFIESSIAALPMHHGVYIDIFPLDGYPTDDRAVQRLERKKHICQLKIACVYNIEYSRRAKRFFALERLLGYHKRTAKTVQKLEKTISAFSTGSSQIWCNHGNWQGKAEYAPREQYGDGAWATFEGLRVRIPEKYDEYLTQKYGEWRAELPPEQQVGHHFAEVVDLTRPYTDYVKKLPNDKITIVSPKRSK